jgi:thiol:disulfide interchange protein DsbD
VTAARRLGALGLALVCWHGAGMAASPDDLDDLVRARLVAEGAAKPGGTVWLALHLAMKPGWHTYWRNPGDAGQATEIEWKLPKGFAAGDIVWPVPLAIPAGIGVSYGYEGEAALLVPVAVPAAAKAGSVELRAEANWLVCKDICLPGEAVLSAALRVGAGKADPKAAELFRRARAALPQELKAPAQARAGESAIALELPAEALKGMAAPGAVFMPYDGTLIDHAAPQTLEGATLTLKRGPVQGKPPAETAGLLVVEDGQTGAKRAYGLAVKIRAEAE